MQAFLLTILGFLGLAVVPLCHAQLQVVNTGRMGNTVQLECRPNGGGIPVPGAMFWLNEVVPRQEVRELTDNFLVDNNGRITFIITRELEGTYYCGRSLINVSSEGQELIAYPEPTIPPSNERTFFAKVGTTARLDCSILPGALRRQYFADWIKATSMTEVARVVGPRNSQIQPVPRFMVDEETFSLTIDDVLLTDSGSYQCVLGVRDPGGLDFFYSQTRAVNLTLVVYQAPFITRGPRDVTVALNNSLPSQNATFRCQARGSPAPEIEWFHKRTDRDVVAIAESTVPGKYAVNRFQSETATGDFIVTSVLTINDLSPGDGGVVKCLVEADDDDISDVEFQSSLDTATLAVIGGVENLDLFVTTNGDVLFALQLPSAILAPVRLCIHYTETEGQGRTMRRVSSTIYNNTSLIKHFEPSALVPSEFARARVGIALRFQDMQGPTTMSDLDYDLRTANVFTEEEASVKRTIIVGVTVSISIVAFLLAIVIPVLVSIVSRRKIKEGEIEAKRTLDELKEEHRADLEQMKLDIKSSKELNEKNEATLRAEREEHANELERMRAELESENKKLREENEAKLKLLKEKNDHELNMKVLEVAQEVSRGMSFKEVSLTLGSTKLSIKTDIDHKESSAGTDMTDGCLPDSHTYYKAHSRRPMLTRGDTIDYDSEGKDLHEQEGNALDYLKGLLRASVKDPRLGPTLTKFVSSELL